ncbi:QacE family quaternary ammonium compound efflux SMR transporter [Kocuria dechangensis]|jgi:quaternary ammonium compound-resistance protein SugE|uniref:QacE family quaternary ammonium compound efflux SMR transporter n=1 Tax=Kocuria dechangensis TaxID=1176249 RepID=A0A917GI68_9MICC|nr:SMR family transporter [Kocuria dechangensis]GGG46535.1 QacE family quaternary ammonium compound efflux SMR transporter [Kocuria dechangensis]
MGAWTVLVLSGVLEAVWASALAASDGFRRPLPVLVFALSAAVSMAGLAHAMTVLPVGTAYAVWVGIGGALTAAWSMLTGRESAAPFKVLMVLGIIGCVIGLRLVG